MVEQLRNGVYSFLATVGMTKHWNMFQAKGFEREDDIPELEELDLDGMNIMDGEKKLILDAAAVYQVTEGFQLRCWLARCGLCHYADNLSRIDCSTLDHLKSLDLTPEVFANLEMDMPGHRKKLQKAVLHLRKKAKVLGDAEEPIVKGYWGRPPCLLNGTREFLCLRAVIQSSTDPARNEELEFMVDSGSEVMTIQQDVLSRLGLQQLTTISSQGIHASRQRPLYAAKLKLGELTIDTEVIPDTYDSIGINVIRSFRHYIDSNRHFWLRGNCTSSYKLESTVQNPSLPNISIESRSTKGDAIPDSPAAGSYSANPSEESALNL